MTARRRGRATYGRDDECNAVLLAELAVLIRRAVICHDRMHSVERRDAHIGAPPELGVVGDQDHAVSGGDHGGLDIGVDIAGSAQSQVFRDSGDREEECVDANLLKH